jgi:hypothetical protein
MADADPYVNPQMKTHIRHSIEDGDAPKNYKHTSLKHFKVDTNYIKILQKLESSGCR